MAIAIKKDILYRTIDGKSLHIDAYYPKTGSGYPCAMVVHGGGWKSGDEDDNQIDGQNFANAGFVAFAAEYRLAPPGGHWHANAPVDDLLALCQWVQANAAGFHGDGSRIVALGGSAGGHLIQMLAVRSAIRAGASWSGPSYLPGIQDVLALDGSGIVVAPNYVGCTLADCPQQWEDASPRPSVSAATAPLYLANSDNEVIPLEQATGMADALQAAGVPHQIHILPGVRHSVQYRADVWPETLTFLRSYT